MISLSLNLERSVPSEELKPLPWSGRSGMIAFFQSRGFQVGKSACLHCNTKITIILSPDRDSKTIPCPSCKGGKSRFTPFRSAIAE